MSHIIGVELIESKRMWARVSYNMWFTYFISYQGTEMIEIKFHFFLLRLISIDLPPSQHVVVFY